MCRIYRSGIKSLRGAWPEAGAEALVASDELRGFIPAATGLALYQIGEIKLHRGDLPAAEEALLGAHGFGRTTEPAFSLLRLAQGKVDGAVASITRALNEPAPASWFGPPGSELYRLRLLPAKVEIALAAGDFQTARAAADELATLAERFKTLPARAAALTAAGAVELAEGDASSAVATLREAVSRWSELEAPYDQARARMILADAFAATGAPDRAAVERRARDTFERLGATLDLKRAEATLAGTDAGSMGTATQRVVRTFMFTDIVGSTRLAESLGDDVWDRLIRWHDQTLRAAAAEQGGEEVKDTGDGFFMAFPDADAAIQAAMSMQRRLAAHGAEHAAELAVRIGVHQAQANRVGLDYAGIGINQAARIGDAAEGGEILVSAPTLEGVRHAYPESSRRSVELKGISAPVEVVSIAWG
jgi:class 3 adenylate cyclase